MDGVPEGLAARGVLADASGAFDDVYFLVPDGGVWRVGAPQCTRLLGPRGEPLTHKNSFAVSDDGALWVHGVSERELLRRDAAGRWSTIDVATEARSKEFALSPGLRGSVLLIEDQGVLASPPTARAAKCLQASMSSALRRRQTGRSSSRPGRQASTRSARSAPACAAACFKAGGA